MDVHDVWQQHKRFLLAVAGAGVVLLIAKGLIHSTWDAPAAERSVMLRHRSLATSAAPAPAALSDLQRKNSGAEERLAALVERMHFDTAERFSLARDERSPDLRFNEVRAGAAEELVAVARKRNIKVDESLGLPPFTPSGREAIQRHLRALNLVTRVVEAAILAEVRAVDEIEMQDPAGRRRRDADGFLDALAVEFRVTGTTSSIAELIDLLTREDEAYLALQDAVIEVDDRKAFGLTTLKLTVAALAVDPEAAPPESRRR